MRGQDELTRRRRLKQGRCATHGVNLAPIGPVWPERPDGTPDLVNGPVAFEVACPRADCDGKGQMSLTGVITSWTDAFTRIQQLAADTEPD